MTRLLLLPFLLLGACLLAGLYGAVHNQISYSVGPDYFHAFKFRQFGIPADQHGRLGAAIVGWRASWWMGLIIGAPIALLSIAIPGAARAAKTFAMAAILVVGLTLGLGLASLLFTVPPDLYHLMYVPTGLSDPAPFVRAGFMHNTSYLAGLIGLAFGVVFMAWRIWRVRRETRAEPS
ncbi:signal peptide protein [Actibacterium atlanticum]|uniref:Signal peptide protein n=1 Tax=Actibacterium atlanticum TaxID=1461693 RepID=A0A058ZPZ4_9RHOB|nr:hypothetical protein [Actibacterium atlanticum]KCV82921.1 signal peptide protein [Actibacterium atlanticum]